MAPARALTVRGKMGTAEAAAGEAKMTFKQAEGFIDPLSESRDLLRDALSESRDPLSESSGIAAAAVGSPILEGGAEGRGGETVDRHGTEAPAAAPEDAAEGLTTAEEAEAAAAAAVASAMMGGSDRGRGSGGAASSQARIQARAALAKATARAAALAAFVDAIREADPEELSEHTATFCGSVVGRWMGLSFSIYDAGLRADKVGSFPFPVREEMASVTYATNILKSRPHSLSVVLRDTAEDEAVVTSSKRGERAGRLLAGEPPVTPVAPQPTSRASEENDDENGSFTETFGLRLPRPGRPLAEQQRSGQTPGIRVLRNTMPEWDDALEAYTLPFYQRVVLPSKKNVHIVQPHAPDDIVMLFGKRAKTADAQITTFSLDYCRPVSSLVAFGIALTSFFGSA